MQNHSISDKRLACDELEKVGSQDLISAEERVEGGRHAVDK